VFVVVVVVVVVADKIARYRCLYKGRVEDGVLICEHSVVYG